MESWEKNKDREDMNLGDEEEFGWVVVVPVAELVGKDGFDFGRRGLIDEGIKDDDVLALGMRTGRIIALWKGVSEKEKTYPWKTEEVSVTVRAAF